MSTRRAPSPLGLLLALLLAGCTSMPVAAPQAGGAAPAEAPGTLKGFGAYATAIEEPWDGVIHAALNQAQDAGTIEYTYTDDIGYSGDMERILREVAEENKPAIIFGDAFGNEEAVRRVATDYPEIAFVFGSGGGPAEPNFSVFDNWIHEPAYLSGMLAGGLTKSNTIGVVGGLPVPEVNRIVNAFIAGAREINPEVEVKTTFINSWFDPAAAKEAALAQIDAATAEPLLDRLGPDIASARQRCATLAFDTVKHACHKLNSHRIVSPRLIHAEQLADFELEVSQDAADIDG